MRKLIVEATPTWRCLLLATLLSLTSGEVVMGQGQAPAPITAIRAGRLLDPEAGRILTNQVILVEGTRIREVGANLAIPPNARVIDLSAMTVMPGLVEAHNHLALTYKPFPENNVYYYTYVQESTALRAIQAASNGIQMLAADLEEDARDLVIETRLALLEQPDLAPADQIPTARGGG